MKRLTLVALGVLASACTAGSLQAQSREVRANIPFDFAVGSKQLPAGHYRFYTESNDTLVIQGDAPGASALSRVYGADDSGRGSSRLIFDRFGDRYFLREIQATSIAINAEIPASKLEKQLGVQRAWLGPERTLLALN